MVGWLKLYRDLGDKPIWLESTSDQRSVLVALLMMVNYEPNKWEWQGKQYECMPGQVITSLPKIAERSGKGVSIQNVRTALNRFEKLGFLTNESTNKNRLITIVNWGFYQCSDDEPNRQTNRQLTGTQQATNSYIRSKEVKKKELKDNSPKSTKRIYDVDSIHYQLAEYLFEEMKKNNPEARKPDFHKWANDIRLMMEIDNRKEEQVRNMITWSQSNDFWKGNILSAKKLRDKYDQMKVQANQSYKNNNAAAPKNDSVKYDIKQSEFFKVPEGYSFDD